MLTTERHILKSLQHVTSELPYPINKKDSHFVIEATNAVITALLDAEEPINKTHRYHERAKHITEDLQAFIQYRRKEQWSVNSAYAYKSYGITEKRPKEA